MRLCVAAALAAAVAGCAAIATQDAARGPSPEEVKAVLQSSFQAKGQAKLDRLDQDEVQRLCSTVRPGHALAPEAAHRIEAAQMAAIRYPQGSLVGDWKSGEKIAQQGTGKQYSDNPAQPSGGNCYACHQLDTAEVAYGNMGPSLHRFGATRGYTAEMQQYVYAKVYDSDAFSACSNMPRFGHMGILTEQQIKDVVALLMDPKSPVNQ
jgi:sulfur-oxidizing protein SoxX